MKNIQIFQNTEFGQVRTIDELGTILFCGSDVAKALGYARANDAISAHCKYTVKRRIATKQGNEAEMSFIHEGDLYRLITHSKLPSAEKFERWVFDEVLPSIRRNGGYIMEQETLSDDELLAKALMVAKNKISEKDRKIEADKPKVLFADAVSASETAISISDLEKLLNQNGVDIGQRRLFEYLRSNGYLIKRKGTEWNMPTQRAMDMKLFEIRETAITRSSGYVTISKTTKVTGKGQQYFINKFLAADAV